MTDYIRLAEAPRWVLQYPTCSACVVELENDGDGWTCPCCGTSWANDAGDGDAGDLYVDWAGEEATGPITPENEAHLWGDYMERMDRHRRFPKLCPEPIRPNLKAGV
ncbi:MAG TPA: hypothetical protein VJL80_14525 [Aeromicrobium sp.]|nr:hypothetical protein [Aeromicrobium sp.]HKY59249.1 hypothetical protein [Aeromicrobium sp.]